MKRQKKEPRLCIGGYAGCGNLGDDAALCGMLEGLFQNGILPGQVTVLSGQPRRDSRRFGVHCANRKNPFAVLVALLRSAVFISGGGTLLQNKTGNRSLYYYLALLRLARFCGCRTVLFGGLGPLSGVRARRAVGKELEACAAVLLRDEESLALFKATGAKNTRVTVGADPAFLLPDPPHLRTAFLLHRLMGNVKKPLLCVCPAGGVAISGLSALLRRSFSGFSKLYLLCDPLRDEFPARRLKETFGGTIYAPRDFSEATALFSAAAIVLSCRLHPLILSVRVGARCVCFSGGEVKLSAFCRRAGIPCFSAEGNDILPSADAFLSLPAPQNREFCQMAAKDLAILSRIVYNGSIETSSAESAEKGRKLHEERTVGGSAPPDHH